MSGSVAAGRRRLLHGLNALGAISGLIVPLCVVLAAIGPDVAPYKPGEIVSSDIFGGMSAKFPLGTDYLGRDMLSRILSGARFTIGVALPATMFASAAGTVLGILAASRGGALDAVLSRAMDTLISFPSIIFTLVVIAGLGSSVPVLIMAAAVIYTPRCYRIVRAIAVDISATDFVRAARARASGAWRSCWARSCRTWSRRS